jgi:hypothetical protein
LSSAHAAEAELKKYGQFMEDYTEKLKQGLKQSQVHFLKIKGPLNSGKWHVIKHRYIFKDKGTFEFWEMACH